ncbi:MAG: ParA family partition ATPase [Kofleriaceae bacterium]|nr:ParA family partition ATPase [Kofleriaceae bacterium]
MPIIALLAEKGGAGKTTIAVNIAAELHARGQRVLLVDADPQGTALAWAGIGGERGLSLPTTIAMGDNLRAQLPAASAGYDWTVVDLPGRVSKRAVGALMVADAALLPCSPSPADAWALVSTAELLGEARELRPDLQAAVVLNRSDRTAIGASTREAVAGLGLPMLAATLGDRVAYREALAAGQGVTKYAGGTVAANEVRRVVDELEDLVGAPSYAAAAGEE